MQPPPGWADPAAAIAMATDMPVPQMRPTPVSEYDLPIGLINARGELVTSVSIREMTGFDEEEMARHDIRKNVAVWVTKLLLLTVETIGGEKPDAEVIRNLLIGDRDALVNFVRRTTYGDLYEFELTCSVCKGKSKIGIDLSTEIQQTPIEDPMVRTFEIPLRRGVAKVRFLTGADQEAFSETLSKQPKTQAEIDTLMLARSVIEIDGQLTFGDENAVRRLPAADRSTLSEFIGTKQPGPQTMTPIPVNCATCGEEYPITPGIGDLFRI